MGYRAIYWMEIYMLVSMCFYVCASIYTYIQQEEGNKKKNTLRGKPLTIKPLISK